MGVAHQNYEYIRLCKYQKIIIFMELSTYFKSIQYGNY